MTNPFAPQPNAAPAQPQFQPQQAPPQPQYQAPQYQPPQYQAPQPQQAPAQFAAPANGQAHPETFADAPSTVPAAAGDPFADPAGPGSGEMIANMVGRLLLVKPLECIPEMMTKQGLGKDVIRADIAILDHPTEPGHIADGVLVFQTCLKRDLKLILEGSNTYLIGRLVMGEAKGGNNAPYLFAKATIEEKNLARQFLATIKF
jgi:hypothetical protein